jgi:hypothetical protein
MGGGRSEGAKLSEPAETERRRATFSHVHTSENPFHLPPFTYNLSVSDDQNVGVLGLRTKQLFVDSINTERFV